jgi:hypothetical protein
MKLKQLISLSLYLFIKFKFFEKLQFEIEDNF